MNMLTLTAIVDDWKVMLMLLVVVFLIKKEARV